MSEVAKFSSQMRREVLDAARAHAAESGRTLASVLEEAVGEYLHRSRVRPAFTNTMEKVLDRNADLLERLAR